MTLREGAEKYAAPYEETGFADDIATAYSIGFREAIELAAEKCATSGAGDCCHETAERNADAIRALAESETPPGACL